MTPWIYPIDTKFLHGATNPTSKLFSGRPEWASGPELPDSEQVKTTPGTALQPVTLSDTGQLWSISVQLVSN